MILALPEDASILDLGCGGGEPIDRFLIDQGFSVTGVDLSQSTVDLARKRFPRARWIKGDMCTVAIEETFDAVIAWNALTGLSQEDQSLMLTRANAWLKPNGRLLCTMVADHDLSREDYRSGSPYRADLEGTNHGAVIAQLGLIEIAHVPADSACRGASVWLVRKPSAPVN